VAGTFSLVSPSMTEVDELRRVLGDSYRVERELGGGGMSRVFLAEDQRLGRKVVIKVLSALEAEGLSVQRFEREIRLAASLQHPNIVPLLSAGAANGVPYYTMPFVEGEGLRSRLSRGPLPVSEAISILRDVARALAYAHERGVIHRDIKPDNVLLSGAVAVVTDFGIAKALAAAQTSPGRDRLTSSGLTLGTPAYMSPEQAAGDPNIDHRADIYSLGCLAFELIAGRPPFDGRPPHRMVAAHMTEPPPSLASRRPDAPPALASLVDRCLAKDPVDRPQSAEELLAALESVIAAPPQVGPFRSWNRVALAGVVALGLLVVGVAALMMFRAMGIGPARSLVGAGQMKERDVLVVTDFAVHGVDSSLSAAVSEAVRTALAQSRIVSVLNPARTGAALARMTRPPTTPLDVSLAREVGAREGAKAVVDGTVSPLGSGFLLSLRLVTVDSGAQLASFQENAKGPDDFVRAIDRLTRALRAKIGESLKSVHADPPLAQVTTSSLEALQKFAQARRATNLESDFATAATLLREAVTLDTAFAMAYRSLGLMYANMRFPRSKVDSAFAQAYRHRDRLTERERYLTTIDFFSGPGSDRARSIAAAEEFLSKAPGEFASFNNLGLQYLSRRDYPRAESLFRRSLAIQSSVPAKANMITISIMQSRFDSAEQRAAALAAAQPTIVFPLGYALAARGRFDSAKVVLMRGRGVATQDDARWWTTDALAGIALIEGQLQLAQRLRHENIVRNTARNADASPLDPALDQAWLDAWFRDRRDRAVHVLDSAVAATPRRKLNLEARRDFRLASLYAMAGRPDRARAVLAEFDGDIKDTLARRAMEPARHRALAEIALGEHRARDAIAEIRRGETLLDGPADDCARCTHAALARAFDLATMPDSAIAQFEAYLVTPYWRTYIDSADASYLAGAYKRLGELYESKNDLPRAEAAYTRFVELWRNADPELQAKVEEVKSRLTLIERRKRR
jgi:serine/threonine-protein kinase